MSTHIPPKMPHNYKEPESLPDPQVIVDDFPESFIGKAMFEALFQTPLHFHHMTEYGLCEALFKAPTPPPLENRLRHRFWREYDIAKSTGKSMNRTKIHEGICTNTAFFMKLRVKPEIMAFMIRRPPECKTALEEILSIGVDEMRAVMTAPIVDKRGRPIGAVMKLKFELFKWMYEQEHGTAVQRTMNLNLNRGDNGKEALPAPEKMKDIDARLEELRTQLKPSLPPAELRPIFEVERLTEKVDLYVPEKKEGGD